MNKEPEKEDGNIEYKLHILNKTSERIEELSTQMSYRLEEGNGQCIYILGISDCGENIGITEQQYQSSLENLKKICTNNNSVIIDTTSKELQDTKKIYEVLIRENITNKYIDIKVAVAGNVDSGKSTLIGVLINGKNDNGRGSARLSVFNFVHEVKSGRTSSIAHHILGFDSKGQIVNYNDIHKQEWTDIVKQSSKIISFYDLAGHEKYLKTTILGLSSTIPDICFITIGANMGITRMTKEHIFICIMLNIPFVIIITKTDICIDRQNVLDNTVEEIKKLLKFPGIRKICYKVNTKDDISLCTKPSNINSIVPLFFVSNVNGNGIDNLKQYLNFVNKRNVNLNNYTKDVEYHIDTTFYVSGVGTVLGGHLVNGTIRNGDKLFLGPTKTDSYEPYLVKSIHCKRTLVNEVRSSCYACIALRKLPKKNIRKGQVLVSSIINKYIVRQFEAKVTILKTHSTTIKIGYEPVLHVSTVRQTAKILDISGILKHKQNTNDKSNDKEINYLRTGDKATLKFRFKYRPEYIKEGYKILLAEGKVKIVGVVTKIT